MIPPRVFAPHAVAAASVSAPTNISLHARTRIAFNAAASFVRFSRDALFGGVGGSGGLASREERSR